MRALEASPPFGLDNLNVVEQPDPTPGPGEVLVRMKAASLNYRDLMTVMYGSGSTGPLVPLSDGCGVIEAVEAST